MSRTIGQMHSSCAVFDEKQDIQRLQSQGLDSEKITRQKLIFVVIQEHTP
jgi:hypothetical protein